MESWVLLAATGTGEAVIGAVAVASFFAAVMVVVWQVAASWRARISAAREEAYRKLTEDAVAWQRQATAALERMTAELSELRARTAEVERVLKEVG